MKHKSYLDLKETQEAIDYCKEAFRANLSRALNLQRVSAPLVVLAGSGINDRLSGVEKPIDFEIRGVKGRGEIVQSLAKWKRIALADYGFKHGEGIYTDMNAIRRDESEIDETHSIYVDQWDWEKVISEEERNMEYLEKIVKRIYKAMRKTEESVCERYGNLPEPFLPEDICFIHSEELLERYYPNLSLSQRERENAICMEKSAVFVTGIGWKLKDGKPHDARAADYDDWSTETEDGYHGLNGDILVWNPVLESAFELSSMGIRVNGDVLLKQLEIKGEVDKKELHYHKRLLNGELPLTIGGGIGQSRLAMLYLRKAHIGEVQSSIWTDEMREECKEKGIHLL